MKCEPDRRWKQDVSVHSFEIDSKSNRDKMGLVKAVDRRLTKHRSSCRNDTSHSLITTNAAPPQFIEKTRHCAMYCDSHTLKVATRGPRGEHQEIWPLSGG